MLDPNEIYDKVLQGEQVINKHKFITEDNLKDYYNLFLLIMSFYDQMFLLEVSFTIIKEILINAVKANAKRVHFIRNGLDINNPTDYSSGMESFAEEVTMKWMEQEKFLEESQFYIQTNCLMKDNNFLFIVENNAPVMPVEQERIKKRMEAAKSYNDLSDAFEDMSDTTESAGLGLVLTQILLKNSGIGRDNFKLIFQPEKTMVLFQIPSHVIPQVAGVSKFNAKVLDEIENLPPLPKNIHKIIELCNDPEANIINISNEIERDPALSADLLKLSNSTYFITRNKVNTIQNAIKIVGLKNLKNLLYVSGVAKILNSRYEKAQEIWDHSAKCSSYARLLAIEFNKQKIIDIAATAGLLHDIGKLVLLSLDKTITQRVEFLKGKEKNNSVLLEEYSMGISHPDIGAQLLTKWGFPEELISVVQYHHRPFLAPHDYRELTEITYLANNFIDLKDGKTSYSVMFGPILEEYGLTSEEKVNELITKLNNQMVKH
jgi:putative nucleotidyltransferase with HDIG domain